MAFEYVIDFECPIKERFGLDGFVERVKQRSMLEAILEEGRSGGKSEEEILADTVTHIVAQGGERKTRKTTVSEIAARVAEITEMRGCCFDCPANAAKDAFGCYGALNYPISARGEEYVMDRFRWSPGPVGSFIQHLIESNNVDGSRIAVQRPGGSAAVNAPGIHAIFERPVCVVREREDFPGAGGGEPSDGRTITSDQIFELLFGLGKWEPVTLINFLKDFGAIDPAKAEMAATVESMRGLFEMMGRELPPELADAELDLGELLEHPDPDAFEGEDRTIVQFNEFLAAVHRAAANRWSLLTDG